ncbi:hypothetical protein N7523_011152 [Penicillium sp. IBT 18751x]|nr:hypothetical protein N7523_011152 [Penicillium sp. IBT 18751x]
MVSKAPADCCLTGFAREGNPTGEDGHIGDIATYISRPQGNGKEKKAILFLSDIFGIYQNSKLLADAFAEQGYLTIVPDILAGDAVPFEPYLAGKFDIKEWGSRHDAPQVDLIVTSVARYLREHMGIERLAAVGYCFGGRWVARFLRDSVLDVGYTAHPSFITREELGAIQGPLSIAAASIDEIFPAPLRHESEEILIATKQPFQINLFSNVTHGFAVRSNLSKPENRFAQAAAFQQAVAWFDYYL